MGQISIAVRQRIRGRSPAEQPPLLWTGPPKKNGPAGPFLYRVLPDRHSGNSGKLRRVERFAASFSFAFMAEVMTTAFAAVTARTTTLGVFVAT